MTITPSRAPLATELGIYLDEETGAFCLEPSGATLSDDVSSVARGAIIAFADHVVGSHLRRAFDAPVALSTLNLRLDWLLEPEGLHGVIGRPQIVHRDASTAVVSLKLFLSGQSAPFAIATARMMIGAAPGGSTKVLPEPLIASSGAPSLAFENFRDFVGFETVDGATITPPHYRLVGNAAVSAFHGGVIAAALDTAGRNVVGVWPGEGRRCQALGLWVEYLRPAMTTSGALSTVARINREGRSLLSVDIEAIIGADPVVVARACMKFAADEDFRLSAAAA